MDIHPLNDFLFQLKSGGGRGNCLAQDETYLLHILEDNYDINGERNSVSDIALMKKYDIASRPPSQDDHDYDDIPQYSRSFVSEFKNAVVGHIAGFVGRNVARKLMCFHCHTALGSREAQTTASLTTLKDRGGFFKPSASLIKVCLDTEVKFQRMLITTKGKLPTGMKTSLEKEDQH